MHILQQQRRCSGDEDRIAFLHIPTARSLAATYGSTSREIHQDHQDLSCVMCHHVTPGDPALALLAEGPTDYWTGSCYARITRTLTLASKVRKTSHGVPLTDNMCKNITLNL